MSSFDLKILPGAEIFHPIKSTQWSRIDGSILLQTPPAPPTNRPPDHSISWIDRAVLVPGRSLKYPVQIPYGQFPQAEGHYLTSSGTGSARKVVAGPVEVTLAQEEGFSQNKRLGLP